ncbi:MAG: shikimate kinase [Bacteroidales bacterium]|nr:shikimate kinase [Bacteroidales bacterium]
MIVSLTGFMGSGKSSVGKVLAEKLSCPFVDLDSLIETGEGRSIPEIFASGGEALFRSLELKYLDTLLDGAAAPQGLAVTKASPKCSPLSVPTAPIDIVLALGGGTLTKEECAELVREKTFCVYLRASAETLVENLRGSEEGRPMLAGGSLEDKVEELLAKRESLYEGTARAIIDTDGQTYGETAEAVIAVLALS